MSNENKTILIVDDEPDMGWALERIFQGMGLLSAKAGSGEEALRLVEQTSFRLAFVDAKLPDIEGIDLARRIRQVRPDLLVVLVSGYFYEHDEEVQGHVNEGLLFGFIGKPFLLDQVRKIVSSAERRM